MEWFRFYNRVVHDPKIQAIPAPLFKFWVNCLCIASDNGGILPNVPAMAFHLHMREQVVIESLTKLIDEYFLFDRKDGLILPHDWSFWQRRSDSSAERVRKHRSKHPGPVSVTDASIVSVTDVKRYMPVTSRARSEQNRADTEQSRTEQSRFEQFFEAIYVAHPKKGERDLAAQYLSEVDGIENSELQAEILRVHALYCALPGWTKDGGAYVPKLSQWILDRSWHYPPSEDPISRMIRESQERAANGH